MIPVEVITLLSSSGVGAALKLVSKSIELGKLANARSDAERKQYLEAVTAARKYQPAGGVWTRRTIVWAMLSTVFVAPTIVACFDIPIIYGYAETGTRFLWGLFTPGTDKMRFVQVHGMVILPIHTHMAASIGGFYFGTSAVK
jgi:hypothetical protein